MAPFDGKLFEVVVAPAITPSHPSRPAMPEGHRRLLVLAEFLETKVPATQYDMREFLHECGAPSCAIGWGKVIPEFAAAGYWPDYIGAEEFFSLDCRQSAHLFNGTQNHGDLPRQTAARIRAFVSASTDEPARDTSERSEGAIKR